MKVSPQIEQSWKELLVDEFNADYFASLKTFLVDELSKNTVYPSAKKIFTAFDAVKVQDVKIVILGQDPYHGHGQAHGLSFSVPDGVKQPPSLVNIFKELHSDLGVKIPKSGNLESWAKQGVLLLNATLTVRANQAGSHQNKGWETFTDNAIQKLASKTDNVVFMLWGKFAQSKENLIDEKKHLVLKAPHPSPFSAHSGFFGSKHFSKANDYLVAKGKSPIDWTIE